MEGTMPTQPFSLLMVCLLLVPHCFRWLRGYWPLVLLVPFVIILGILGYVAFMFEPFSIWDVFLFMGVYGIALHSFSCEVLLRGGAQWLTEKRGEKWVKELDYFYLALGLVGVLSSVIRIEHVGGRFSKIDILAALVLVTAIAIRFIKTRAEIDGWNKPHAS
jgi:hypothetical protein